MMLWSSYSYTTVLMMCPPTGENVLDTPVLNQNFSQQSHKLGPVAVHGAENQHLCFSLLPSISSFSTSQVWYLEKLKPI